MKILDRYILTIFTKSWILGIFGSIVIFFSKDLFDIIHGMLLGEYSFVDAVYLLTYSISTIISFEMMHLSALLGSLIAMTRLNSNFELIALETAGIKLNRIIRAPLIITLFGSIMLIAFTEFVAIKGNKLSHIIRSGKSNDDFLKFRRNVNFKSVDGYFIRIGRVNGKSNLANNMQIIYVNKELNKIEKMISAKVAYYSPKEEEWNLGEVHVFDSVDNSNVFYDEMKIKLRESMEVFLKKLYEKERDQKRLSIPEILDHLAFLKSSGKDNTLLTAHLYHRRIAYPFSVFVMTMIGLALVAGINLSGSGYAIVLGIIIGFVYYVVVEVFFALALGHLLSPFLSAIMPNLIFSGFGLYLLKRAEK